MAHPADGGLRFSGVGTLFLLFLLLPLSLAAGDRGEVEDLSRLVAQALAENSELAASEARWRMTVSRVDQATALPDPMVMLKIQNALLRDPLNFRREAMTAKVIGISQEFPFQGKRGLKGEIAAKEGESLRWSHEERRLELVRMVKETYYRLYDIDRELALVERNITLLDTLVSLVQTRYSVGQTAQQDVLKAQIERSRMEEMRITLTQERRSLETTMNALLNRPSATPVGAIPELKEEPLGKSSEELEQLAYRHRPLLKSYQALVAKGGAAQRLAQREYYPDVTLSLEYMQRDPVMGEPGDDMYSLGVTFNLPLQRGSRRAMTSESAAESSMAQAELAATRNSIRAAIADKVAQLERRQQLLELYRTGLIPQASQGLESATIGYQVGKVDVMNVLDSRSTLYGYERDYFRMKADYAMGMAELEALVGVELSYQALDSVPSSSGTPAAGVSP
ncbi:MAG TPA: TolC family protein [Geobacterales bacterium]|nr:TolC family protein [Geobacterales bacterium]